MITRRVSKTAAALLALSMTACMLMEEGAWRHSGETGYVRLQLNLERNARPVLGKSVAAADTSFDLDSLIVVFSAPGFPQESYSYPVSGRADTGNIAVSLPAYSLPALRNWTATFYSIDERLSPPGRDTVHIDSVVFGVLPGDTAVVQKTVSPAFAILRARFISTQADSVPNTVLWVRLRVDGVTRDSQVVGNSQSSLNWLQALAGSRIIAVGDSGKVLRSTDNGVSWTQQTLVGAPDMAAGHFFNDEVGYVVGRTGELFKSEDSGKSWEARTVFADSVHALHMTDANTGFVAGSNGAIYKFVGNGWTKHPNISNTTRRLNGIHFPAASIGYAVGENETILRTVNGTADGFNVLWNSVAGGWFPQYSYVNGNSANPRMTNDIRGVHFISKDTGWAAGADGYLYVTYNGGALWNARLRDFSINAVAFKEPSVGWIAGEGGVVRKFVTQYDWRNLPNAQVGTTETIYDIQPASPDTAFLVGANGTLRRTVNAVQPENKIADILWSAMPFPVSDASAWSSVNSNTTESLHAMHFVNANVGFAVGSNRVVLRTNDGGQTWTATTVGATGSGNTWYGVFALNANTAYIVGDGNGNGNNSNLRRTTDGGANWETLATGFSGTIRGFAAISATEGWLVGPSNLIRRTTNLNATTPTWSTPTIEGTGNYNAIHARPDGHVWVVGDNGQIRRAGTWSTAPFESRSDATIGSANLRDVFFHSNDVGWVVGDNGFIAKTTSGGWGTVTWVRQSSPVTENLTRVFFSSADSGYITGANGTVLKTVNGGAVWTVLVTGTNTNLRAGAALGGSSTVVVAGEGGQMFRTTMSGKQPDVAHHLRSVHPFSTSLVFVAGDQATIGRTTNGGAVWKKVAAPSGVTANLHGIHFATATTGWAVGDGGTILKSIDSGKTWEKQVVATSANLLSVRAVSASMAYVTGENGLMLKTVDGGATWYEQETPAGTPNLNRVYFLNPAVGFAVGANGTILKAINEGDNWTGGGIKRAFKGVYFVNAATGWVVGQDGIILKTTDSGATWTEQRRQVGQMLHGVHFRNASVGWVTGENGLILKTTNGGATWSQQATPASVSTTTLRWAHFRNDNAGFVIGGTQTLLSTANGGSDWNANLAAGASGAKIFDRMLAYKYFKPGQQHTVQLQAIDRDSPLRGYQSTIQLMIGAGVDSTVVSPLTPCGRVDSLPCNP